VSALLLVDGLLKCVVTEVVSFSVLAFKTVILQLRPDSHSEKSLKIGQYLMKL